MKLIQFIQRYDHDDNYINHPDLQPLINEIKTIKRPRYLPQFKVPYKKWIPLLKPYVSEKHLKSTISDIKNGYSITSNKNIQCAEPQSNYPMTIKEIKACLQSTLKSLKKGYAWGPFNVDEDLPELLKGGHISPIFTKDESDETKQKIRMLINLSYTDTPNQLSFNDNLLDSEKEVTYIKFKEIIKFIVHNDIIYLWAMDALDAYYRVPIQKQQVKYMGIRLCKMIFYFTCLVFGLSSACQLYTKFADTVQLIMAENNPNLFKNKLKETLIVHYLDDFLGGHHNEQKAKQQFETAKEWWNKLGIPTQDRKCTPPTTAIEWLGYIFDTINREVRITPKRIKKYIKTLTKQIKRYEKNQKSIQGVQLQSIIGQIRSMCQVFSYVAPYLRRAEEQSNKLSNNKHYTRITYDMYKDMKSLRNILLNCKYNSIPFDFILRPTNKPDLTVFTDASTSHGVGGFIANKTDAKHFKIMWKDCTFYDTNFKPDIAWKELCGVVLAILLYAKTFANKIIHFRCDNFAVCKIVAKKCACFKRRDLNELIRILCETAIKYRFYIWIDHVKGVKNTLADALSRNYQTKQFEKDYTLSNTGTNCYNELKILYLTFLKTQKHSKTLTKCDCDRDNETETCKYLNYICKKSNL